MNKLKNFFILWIIFFIGTFSFANENLHYYKLENGLDVYIFENHNAPLAYIEVALKAGAIKQNFETAGLFHLYEHIMFKGNSKFKNAKEVQRALNDFGVANWNGSTGDEFVNYYFTLPAELIEQGLEFWAYAIKEPLLDETELEKEKKVVISEITGNLSSPNKQLNDAIFKNLFPKSPWQLDPAGFEKNIQNCTKEDLIKIKDKYYVANNAAIFVGGDVQKDEVIKLVNKYFSNWKSAYVPKHTEQISKPLASEKFLIQQDAQLPANMAQVMMFYRGPDSEKDVYATYAADIWGSLLENPKNKFSKRICNDKNFKIPSTDYFSAWYYTKLSSGRINFMTVFNEPEKNLLNRVLKFYNKIHNNEIPKIIKNKKYFSKKEFENVKQKIKDKRLISTETAEGFLSELRFWWASAPENYFFTYEQNLNKVSHIDISQFLQKYIIENYPLIVVKVNPEIFKLYESSFAKYGFTEITKDNAFYWNDAPPAENNLFNENNNSKEKENEMEILKLKNGIPFYLKKNTTNSIQNLRIFVLGGAVNTDSNITGIEDALFKIMSKGSKKFSKEKIEKILHDKSASISGYGRSDFATLQMNCLTHHFNDVFEIFSDCFLNPRFSKSEFKILLDDYKFDLTRSSENPKLLLEKIVANNIYKNHPYANTSTPNDFSINNITIEEMKNHHKKILNASRIFIVAVGNFETEKILSLLNHKFGNILNYDFKSIEIPKLIIEKNNILEKCEASNGTAFKQFIFNFPSMHDTDYHAACLAATMYDETLFNIVREKNGTCYSVGNSYKGSKVLYGLLYGININNLTNFDKSILEAQNVFKTMSVEEIEKRLPGFKNSYTTSEYKLTETNSGVASQIATSILFFDDAFALEKFAQKRNAVTAQEIQAAFKKYWIDSDKAEFTVTGY
ncbi:MAG: insulinase family protein [Treponema sp.]|nr:insulinase family protein [Treponema sp.]